MVQSYYKSSNNDFILAHGDCFKLLKEFDFKFDMIFADPPYFLSNGGISLQNGKVVCVDKGDWDKGKSQVDMMSFNMEWLRLCRDKLKDNGTIWISGTYHNIFSVANCLTELGYKILNVIIWEKTNPPVNISCRYFKYSTEFVIWARKMQKVPHKFNYELMKELNDGKQMTDVWRMQQSVVGKRLVANIQHKNLCVCSSERFLHQPTKVIGFLTHLVEVQRLELLLIFVDEDLRGLNRKRSFVS